MSARAERRGVESLAVDRRHRDRELEGRVAARGNHRWDRPQESELGRARERPIPTFAPLERADERGGRHVRDKSQADAPLAKMGELALQAEPRAAERRVDPNFRTPRIGEELTAAPRRARPSAASATAEPARSAWRTRLFLASPSARLVGVASTTTSAAIRSSRDLMRKRLGAGIVHQLSPLLLPARERERIEPAAREDRGCRVGRPHDSEARPREPPEQRASHLSGAEQVDRWGRWGRGAR